MRPTSIISASVYAIVLPALAGCGSGTSSNASLAAANTLPTQHAGSWVRPDSGTTPRIYLADNDNYNIYIFDSSGFQSGMISGLGRPVGIFVDSAQRLWIANTQNRDVLVFPRGSVEPIATYADPGASPIDVTVCPNGTVYVSNSTDSSGLGSISVYKPGKLKPTGTLQDPNEYNNFFIACDANNNVFTTISLLPSGPGAVDEYVGGALRGLKRLPIGLGFPAGIKVEPSSDLLVGDQRASSVAEYTQAGVATGRSVSSGTDVWSEFAIARNGAIVVADPTQKVGLAVAFPAGTVQHTYVPQFVGSGSSPDIILGAAYDPGSRK